MKVPPLNLPAEYLEIKKELSARLARLFKDGQYILGSEVSLFETNFAKLIGTKFASGVASGSDALYLSLVALGIGPGDEVITTSLTYIATGTAIARTGAKPVFVDIEPATFNINPDLIEKKITKRTKVILPVHIYGMPCDMTQIVNIARKHKLKIVEDCAQSTGAEWRGKSTGSFGIFGAFSFYPTKIIGAYGDGGAIVTNDSKLANSILFLRNQSDPHKTYIHPVIGFNSRLDAIQAAILNVKLKRFHSWNQKRIRAAAIYDKLLKENGIPEVIVPRRLPGVKHVYHQYTIRVKKRDALLSFLKKSGVAAGIYYPIPLHLQPCFRYLGYRKGSLPETEKAAREIISLPLFPQISPAQQTFVIQKILEFFRSQ